MIVKAYKMLAVITPRQFTASSVIISPRSDNNVVHGTYFHRYQYAHGSAALSGVYIAVNLKGLQSSEIESHMSRQIVSRITFDTSQNKQLIAGVSELEKALLALVPVHSGAEATYGLSEALSSGAMRNISGTFIPRHGAIILRISGVWEDAAQYGLVYRFIAPSRPL